MESLTASDVKGGKREKKRQYQETLIVWLYKNPKKAKGGCATVGDLKNCKGERMSGLL